MTAVAIDYIDESARAYQSTRINALLDGYKTAQQSIEAALRKGTMTDFGTFRATEQLKQIKAMIAQLNTQCVSVSRDLAKSGYREGVNLAAKAVKATGQDLGAVDMGNKIHVAAVEAMADKMATDLISANGSMERFAQRLVRGTQQKVISETAVNDAVTQGLIKGDTWRSVSKGLREQINEALDGKLKIPINGRNYDPRKYADLVARTMTRAAATEGTINQSLQWGITLFQVSTHGDSCGDCLEFQGKVYSLGPNDYGFPELTDEPPYHPHCGHVLLPYVEMSTKERDMMVELSNGPAMKDQAAYDARIAELRKEAA